MIELIVGGGILLVAASLYAAYKLRQKNKALIDALEKAAKQKEKEALKICEEKVKEHKLDMILTDVEYKFDRSKLLFFFKAEGRIDFRDLVKDLAEIFKTRIELRQIGVRDEVKKLRWKWYVWKRTMLLFIFR